MLPARTDTRARSSFRYYIVARASAVSALILEGRRWSTRRLNWTGAVGSSGGGREGEEVCVVQRGKGEGQSVRIVLACAHPLLVLLFLPPSAILLPPSPSVSAHFPRPSQRHRVRPSPLSLIVGASSRFICRCHISSSSPNRGRSLPPPCHPMRSSSRFRRIIAALAHPARMDLKRDRVASLRRA